MKDIMVLKNYDQLKALSDEFRSQLVIRLMEVPMTGQQLSDIFELTRARVHYHLKELEKNNLIKVVRKEEKNGIVQKFYQATARGYVPDASLLPYQNVVSRTNKQNVINLLDRTRERALETSEDSFKHLKTTTEPSEWNYVAANWEISASEENFQWLIKKQFELMKQFREIRKVDEQNPDAKLFFISNVAFEASTSLYEEK